MDKSQEDFLGYIKQLPSVEDLRKRAIFYTKLYDEADYISSGESYWEENFSGTNSDRYFWNDGGGQEATILFKADGENPDSVLMFAYDHESHFNTYTENDAEDSQIPFHNLPESFAWILKNDGFKWGWDTTFAPEKKIVYATTAIWHEHEATDWNYSADFFNEMAEAHENGQFSYPFKKFFGQEFTLDTLKEEFKEKELDFDDWATIAKIYKEVFDEPKLMRKITEDSR